MGFLIENIPSCLEKIMDIQGPDILNKVVLIVSLVVKPVGRVFISMELFTCFIWKSWLKLLNSTWYCGNIYTTKSTYCMEWSLAPKPSNKKLAPSVEDWAHSHHILGCDFLLVLSGAHAISVKIVIILCLLPLKMLEIIGGLCWSSPERCFCSRKLLRYGMRYSMHWEQCFRLLSEQSDGTVVEEYVYQRVPCLVPSHLYYL